MKAFIRWRRALWIQAAIGAVLGVLVLHPLMTFVYWIEFNDLLRNPADGAWRFFLERLQNETLTELIPMNGLFALIGAILGTVFALYHLTLEEKQHHVQWLERELDANLPSMLATGETERVEFKSTMRWDLREQQVNKTLEKVIVKSIAGLMNHLGGSLLIGVDDAGKVLGIHSDCQTLRHKTTDGFERALMDLVRTTLGAHAGTLIHCQFPEIDTKKICWLVIEPSTTPIFLQDGKVARYVVRMGNSTHELDAREAHAHAALRELNVIRQ